MSPNPTAPPPSADSGSGIFQKRYREITVPAVVFGVLVGILLNASITYSGLKIGFTLGGSAIAAVLGWGVLRGILRKGSIVENNIAQTIASSVNISNSGVIFTVPVIFLVGVEVNPLWLGAACVAGALLGVAFIIPTRKQMIDFDRLRFPTGTAVAAVLRSPGEGVGKSIVLLAGILVSMVVIFFTESRELGLWSYGQMGLASVTDKSVDVAAWIRSIPAVGDLWRPSMSFTWAIAPFAVGAGFITGRPGLVVLAGGVLAYLIITPIAYANGWMPAGVEAAAATGWARENMTKSIGIGMLMGGALMGLVFALPAIGGALRSMRSAQAAGGEQEELPLKVLYIAVAGAFVVLFLAAQATVAGGSLGQAALIALVGTAWMWFAGILIAQCTGMTDWSPISGMALLTVMLCLLLTGNQVVPAVLIGAAVCVAITLCADMMQDLKTGHMVGSIPARQQVMEMAVVWIGPIVAIATVYLLAGRNVDRFGIAFGPDTDMPAAQAVTLQSAIDGIRGGDVPYHLYGTGALLGSLLSVSGIAGLGVLVGLSMYLPFAYLLPYGLGCLLQMACRKLMGVIWTERWGVPLAAGLLVGEGIVGVGFAAFHVWRSSQ